MFVVGHGGWGDDCEEGILMVAGGPVDWAYVRWEVGRGRFP